MCHPTPYNLCSWSSVVEIRSRFSIGGLLCQKCATVSSSHILYGISFTIIRPFIIHCQIKLCGLSAVYPCVATVYRLLNRRRCHDNEVWDESTDQLDRPPPPADFKTNTANTAIQATCVNPHTSPLQAHSTSLWSTASSRFYDSH
jgi:hypothetical protein